MFLILSDDELRTVFSHVDLQDVGRIAKVCKKWWEISRDSSWLPNSISFNVRSSSSQQEDSVLPSWCHQLRYSRTADGCMSNQIIFSKNISSSVSQIVCSDHFTLILLENGRLYCQNKNALYDADKHLFVESPSFEVVETLVDVEIQSIACTPPGYQHTLREGGDHRSTYLAISKSGDLYSWGNSNKYLQLLRGDASMSTESRRTPTKCEFNSGVKVLLASCGRDFTAIQTTIENATIVQTVGKYNEEEAHSLTEHHILRNRTKTIVSGSFFCCALTTSNDLYIWGDPEGKDYANGSLLGPYLHFSFRPIFMKSNIVHVCCSSYSAMATSEDGKTYTWGDNDGFCLGRNTEMRQLYHNVHKQLPFIGTVDYHTDAKCVGGSTCYPMCATIYDDNTLWFWGGMMWMFSKLGRTLQPECLISNFPVPYCYSISNVTQSFNEIYVIFRKKNLVDLLPH